MDMRKSSPNIILVSGKAQSGKDTLARMIKDELVRKKNRVLITHFADLLKYVCKVYFDWDGIKAGAGRSILQIVGTDIVKTEKPTYWIDFVLWFVDLSSDLWDYVIIPDVRFFDEYMSAKSHYKSTFHIRIERTCDDSNLSEEQQNHVSETSVDTIPYDYYIRNDDDMSALYDQVKECLKYMKEGVV